MTDITLTASVYFALALNGLFTGLGSAIGSYLANKGIIERTNQLLKKLGGKPND